jgi:Mrp family chromosome partitioning ATPase
MRQVTDQRQAAQKGLSGKSGGGANLPPRTQAVLDQVSALNDQIAQLANQRAKIASADLSPGAITAAARTPVPSTHDAALLYLLGGLLGGLLLGMVAAHGREALDRRIRSLDQAADLIGVPALGVVRSAGRHSEEAAAADARYVSLAVLKWIHLHPDQPLVVLSGRDDEGRAAVSANLAVALAESGEDVWLAAPRLSHDELRKVLFAAQTRTPPRPRTIPLSDADEPAEARLNGSGGGIASPGVTRLPSQAGRLAVKTSAMQQDDPEATLIMEAPGAAPVITRPPSYFGGAEDGAENRRPLMVLIGGGAVRLCSLGEQPDAGVVVIDAPPSDTDERGVREAQDGVAILVVARDRTRNRELTRLVDRLRSAGAQTAGFVLTGGRGA